MPSDQHVLHVELVKGKKTAKDFDFHRTSALPKPPARLNSGEVCMHDVIEALCRKLSRFTRPNPNIRQCWISLILLLLLPAQKLADEIWSTNPEFVRTP